MTTETTVQETGLDAFLDETSKLLLRTLGETPLRDVLKESKGLFGSGKRLRARLIGRLAEASGRDREALLHAGAAVEMVHAASLLHDDVIDGGFLRRNAPAFWVSKGVPGAILFGDLLLFKALDLAGQVEEGRLTPILVKRTGEVCEAESQQELIIRGASADWDTCVRIARGKTGALFAFAAEVCGGPDPERAAALREAGYLVGTAYQLADDILDASGLAEEAGKTLGTDASRKKTTAMRISGPDGVDPGQAVRDTCQQSLDKLTPWPELHAAWSVYLDRDILPTVERIIDSLRAS